MLEAPTLNPVFSNSLVINPTAERTDRYFSLYLQEVFFLNFNTSYPLVRLKKIMIMSVR